MIQAEVNIWNAAFQQSSVPLRISANQPDSISIIANGRSIPVTLSLECPTHASRETSPPTFYLANFINDRQGKVLREKEIFFADKHGNCFLHTPEVFVDVRGRNKLPAFPTTSRLVKLEAQTRSLFTPRKSQIIAMLLSEPSLLSASVRQIAHASGTSVGTASETLELLYMSGYCEKLSKRYVLPAPEELLDAWSRAYPMSVAANLTLFRGTGDLERLARLEPRQWVSGEQAVADALHQGTTAHIYVDSDTDVKDVIRTGRLRKDEHGNVNLRTAFWNQTGQSPPELLSRGFFAGWKTAPLAIVYADLLSIQDPRAFEVAGLVKETLLERIRAEFS